MKTNILLLLLTSCIFSYAQKAPIKFGDIPMEDMKMTVYAKDSAAEAVILADYAESTLSYNQTKGFQLVFERIRRVKILTKEGLNWANFSIPLYHDSDQEEKLSNLKVTTFNLEGGKIAETKAKSESFLKEKYDANLNFTKVTWPNVGVGSVLELSYKVTSDFVFNFQDWEFQSTVPTRWSEYRAGIPEYYNYEKFMQGYMTLNISENSTKQQSIIINSSERVSSGGFSGPVKTSFSQDKIEYIENNFRWVANDVPAFKKEPFMSTTNDYISKINFELSFTKFPNSGIKQYMGSWEDIAKSYWERAGSEITGNNSLKKTAEEITAGIVAPDAKALAIYNYVKQSVLWDGTNRRYAESSPRKTLDEKKGSSAELNLLLASLLEKVDIQVHPVLLSTRDHGFVRESIPVSTQFNYVICAAQIGEKSVLLDATDRFLPIGMLPEKCLNGKGFQISKDGFRWIELAASFKTRRVYNAELTLTEKGELKGNIKIDKGGYHAMHARKTYINQGETEYVKGFMSNRPWELSKSEFANVNEFSQSFKEMYELTINEHLTDAGGTLYFSPFVIGKETENPFKQETRIYPIDFGHSFDEVYIAKLKIPEGYIIDELPKSKAMALPQNASKFLFNVTATGNLINISSTLSINRNLFTQEEYPNLREFFSQVVAKQAEQIVLKKK
jgi:hypothetical protein